ncbi:hypothetical protein AAF712_006121 [Marasmius tenuissimus]|uniref:FAD-binding domain-containing protein n=1 Tax=Marasmius tenuissimus TaxID=585030 RepID=A0ABR2ZZ98_9AGAR
MSSASLSADVVIVGGGPVGSLLAYQLARFGCQPYLIEQEDKAQSDCYGRATTLWPRTIELLDQLGLADRLLQSGMITRSGLHFHEGKRLRGGIMYGNRMDRLGDTFFKFALHLRQRITEGHFAEALEQEYGFRHHNRLCIDSYTIHEGGSHPVTVHLRDLSNDRVLEVKTRYLIGADGGKSTVRKLAGIPFDGENTKHRWIRMDAATHGQILWCPNDDGLTRIGYVFSPALLEKYGGIEGVTQEVAMEEAKKALHPFTLDFIHVEWFTIYGIGQRIARTFSSRSRVFLAGDACHTHSSGSAQGLNTGIHDAVNLGWKLALCIHRLAGPSLLDSYDRERRPIVQRVIDNDKIISTLISGQYPPQYQGSQESPREILTRWFDDMSMQAFTLGLGINYPISLLNRELVSASIATINPGERGPDVYLSTLGSVSLSIHIRMIHSGNFDYCSTADPIRLHKLIENDGRFSLVVFTGIPSHTYSFFSDFRNAVHQSFSPVFPALVYKWFTVPSVAGNGGQEVLGTKPLGRVYFDESVRAHEMYGVDVRLGAVVVFRPDGWVGTVVQMNEKGAKDLEIYFDGILGNERTRGTRIPGFGASRSRL